MKTIYFSPMANNLNDWVLQSMVGNTICHREEEFTELLQRVRDNLLKIVKANKEKYRTIMLTGSGTAALDSMFSSLPEGAKVLVLSNGHYGDRIRSILDLYGVSMEVMKFQNEMNMFDVEKLIRNPTITHVAMVHHETSTGTLNPLGMIGRACKKYNKILMVDAISSIVMHDVNMVSDNISFLAGSSNKGIGGPEGLSFIIADMLKVFDMNPSRNYYLDIRRNLEAQERSQTPFTPAVRIFQGLDGALNLLEKEGMENRQKKFAEIAKVLREGMKELGFELLTKSPSNVSSLYNLGTNDFNALHKRLKGEGFVIYSGINNQTFRLCTFGDLCLEDIKRFLEVMGTIK